MPNVTTTAGTFFVTQPFWWDLAGIPSHTHAWYCPNSLPTLRTGRRRNTGGKHIPMTRGRLALQLWRDSLNIDLKIRVRGDSDLDGVPSTNPIETVTANLLYLNNIWNADVPAPFTVPLVVHLADGSTRTGPVQIEDFWWPDEIGDAPVIVDAELSLFIPAGRLT